MTDYLTVAEVLAIHQDQIERYAVHTASGIAACWKQHSIARLIKVRDLVNRLLPKPWR